MLFSIVIPTYNRLQLLQRTLESVWRQRFTDYEIIVVDDGSTDGTSEYLQTLSSKARLVSQLNRGPGAARNIGAAQACGDYIAFLDSDDIWFPWTLDIFARAIQEHACPQILGGNFIEFVDEAELIGICEQSYKTSWFPDYIASSRYPYYVGSGTCVLHRRAVAEVKFLEDCLNGEDHDLILRIGTRAGFVRVLAPFTLAWRRHPASATADVNSMVSGAKRLLVREQSGAYPGGLTRSRERHRILTRHTRAVTLGCLQHGLQREAWRLYGATFGWNASLGRVKYLAAFPLMAALWNYARRPAESLETSGGNGIAKVKSSH